MNNPSKHNLPPTPEPQSSRYVTSDESEENIETVNHSESPKSRIGIPQDSMRNYIVTVPPMNHQHKGNKNKEIDKNSEKTNEDMNLSEDEYSRPSYPIDEPVRKALDQSSSK